MSHYIGICPITMELVPLRWNLLNYIGIYSITLEYDQLRLNLPKYIGIYHITLASVPLCWKCSIPLESVPLCWNLSHYIRTWSITLEFPKGFSTVYRQGKIEDLSKLDASPNDHKIYSFSMYPAPIIVHFPDIFFVPNCPDLFFTVLFRWDVIFETIILHR